MLPWKRDSCGEVGVSKLNLEGMDRLISPGVPEPHLRGHLQPWFSVVTSVRAFSFNTRTAGLVVWIGPGVGGRVGCPGVCGSDDVILNA